MRDFLCATSPQRPGHAMRAHHPLWNCMNHTLYKSTQVITPKENRWHTIEKGVHV